MTILTKLLLGLFLVGGLLTTALADDTKLIGHWKGGSIDLNLKADHSYSYKVKVFNFNGNWSAANNVLLLNYSIAGIKRQKTAKYHFQGDDLVMQQGGKGNVILKKQ